MPYIKAPFNFVPVSSEVFYPAWAGQISHDVPFSDGLSGKITLTIEAKTPIFIRDSKQKTEFCHIEKPNGEKTYFIPGTSLKGMVRNVLEIMSFGKLSVDENMRFSTREWDIDYVYNLKTLAEQRNIRCGWLKKENGKIIIVDCGTPKRINHLRIDEFLGINTLENTFKQGGSVDLNETQPINNQEFDPKTACYKYALLGEKVEKLQNKKFIKDEKYTQPYQKNRVMISKEGDLKGTVVFTGQPDNWKLPRVQSAGKFYEFVFTDKNENERLKLDPIRPEDFEKFEYLHQNSNDWNYWKNDLNKKDSKGIPVFFRVNGSSIRDFGLAFLYKVPFTYSPKEINDIYQKISLNSGPDLAQCILGFIDNENEMNHSLKGRVQFSQAKSINTPVPLEKPIETTLGSPRASYYPIYIVQTPAEAHSNRVEKYTTYNDKGAQLKWKRYPVRNKALPFPPTGNENIDVKFRPLESGAKFKSLVRFHNLRPIELGALLSAISFHGNDKKLFHSIGMAKPMGFGKINVSYTLESTGAETPDFYMARFEREMNRFLKKAWIETEQIRELFTMAWDKEEMLRNAELEYMTMSTKHELNQFAKAKEQKEYIKWYTELTRTFFHSDSISKKFDEIDFKKYESAFNEVLSLEAKGDIEKAIICIKEALKIIPNDTLGLETLLRLQKKLEFTRLKIEAEALFESGNFKNAREKFEQAKNYIENPVLIDQSIAKCIALALEQTGLESALNKQGNFDTNIKRIKGYLEKRKMDKLNETDSLVLLEMVKFWIDMKDPNKREWTAAFENSKYWRKIAEWTGREPAERFYQLLIIGKPK